MKVLLYEPDIAGNVGAVIRMCACFDLELNIIEPCGFPFDESRIRRAAMDYFEKVKIRRYDNFGDFRSENSNHRIILLTTKVNTPYHNFKFRMDDIIMVGRESAGTPDDIQKKVDCKVVIPMKNETRCLNVVVSLAIVVGEVMRQCQLY
ncbi:MAG: tRNA (cytidine(34)-2'-O)-methyltransferase [Rickettsiales bacterium]|jgi:tRNA (cytidine/uridine-2'-O-)-methyltransferase|nr:tRNA (cytidine(34)-2'-O)-methyltransferase [Rickettsiales bacterium]